MRILLTSQGLYDHVSHVTNGILIFIKEINKKKTATRLTITLIKSSGSQLLLHIRREREREGKGKHNGEKGRGRGTPWPCPRAIIFKKLLGDSTVDNL